MYKKKNFTLREQTRLAADVFRMVLIGDTSDIREPGQFVNIRIDGFYLRRPISVCDWDAESLTLIYKVVGGGTAALRALSPGAKLELLTGLGNGFDTEAVKAGQSAAIVGGGVGVPPLYALAKKLLAAGVRPVAVLGFNEAGQVFYQKEFEALGVPVCLTTADGSLGMKGFVTDALSGIPYDYYFACGPEPMLRALHRLSAQKGVSGQLSFEARMGCGFGACMGCSCRTLTGYKRICVEGPVMRSEEVRFDG